MTGRANKLVKGAFKSKDEYLKARLDYLRDEDYSFCWEKTNRSVFIDSLYSINSRLPDGKKVTLGLTDVAFDWHKPVTPARYARWYREINADGVRDKEMADNFISQYKRQKPIGGCKKALVITNEPHAVGNPWQGRHGSEGFRIREKLGKGKVRIVCLNWVDTTSDSCPLLVDDRRWDAAFELTRHHPAGFDIAGTVFGQAPCRIFGIREGCWQDYADGIIFYRPFYEFLASTGIKGFMADSQRAEQRRRLDLLRNAGVANPDVDDESYKAYYNTVRLFPCYDGADLDRMRQQMTLALQDTASGVTKDHALPCKTRHIAR